MQQLPKISIVTPSFNQGHFLRETIESVLNQGYENLEYIIIDGGSKDDSVEVIKEYEDQIAYWVSEADDGQSHAINKGFQKATGDIIAWLNSDDYYLPGTLQKVAKYFSQNPDVDLLFGKVENFTGDTTSTIESFYDPNTFHKRVDIHQPGTFWKRELHNEIGYLDQDLHMLMDYDLWMRIFYTYKSLKVDDVFTRFRVHEDAKTFRLTYRFYLDYREVLCRLMASIDMPAEIAFLKEVNLFYNKEGKEYKIGYDFSQEQKKKILQHYLNECALQEYTCGNVRETNRILNAKWPVPKGDAVRKLKLKNNLRIGLIKDKLRSN